jgi:tetratricopeptide (TPR) repeat protein
LWRVPPSNPHFLDVHGILDQIHAEPGKRIALRGLPGVGKTQAAIAYAHRHRSDYEATFWLNAETIDTITSDVATIVRGLGLRVPNLVEQLFDLFRSWFDNPNNARWLLVLDNVADLSIVTRMVPTAGLGRILITTNEYSVGRAVDRDIELTCLDQDAGALALLVLARRVSNVDQFNAANAEDRDAAIKLSVDLGGLMLAIDQAAMFISDCMTPAQYYSLYQTKKQALLRERGLYRDHESVTVTFLLALQRVAEINPASADLVRFCSVLAPDAIPEEILTSGGHDLGDLLSAAVASDLSRLKTIQAACRFSLLRYDPSARTLAIHRLAQVVLSEEMTAEFQQIWYLRSVRAVNHAFPEASFSEWPVCERLLPHAKIAAQRAENFAYEYRDIGFLLNETAAYLRLRAEFSESERLHKQSLAFRRSTLPAGHQNIAESLNDFACLYRDLFVPEKALPLFAEAVAITEGAGDHESEFCALFLNNLGRAYSDIGDYEKAETFLKRALAVKKMSEADHRYLRAGILNNLAEVLLQKGDYTASHAYCKDAIELREEINNPEKLFRSCTTMASILFKLGNLNEAKVQFERALRLTFEVHGPNHPDFIVTLERYAEMLLAIDREDDGMAMADRALAIRKRYNLMPRQRA